VAPREDGDHADSAQDNTRIARAVASAEAQSAGEIVTVITPRSDRYADVALAWSAFIAFSRWPRSKPCPVSMSGWSIGTGPVGQRMDGAVLFRPGAERRRAQVRRNAGGAAMAEAAPVAHPGADPRARVHARALTAFRVGAESRTSGRTGVVLFVSLAEHRAEIIADHAIADKVDPEVWGEAMAALLGPLRENRLAEGMEAAIARIGAVLAETTPRMATTTNELPDGPILL
jgi:putative membrane protein